MVEKVACVNSAYTPPCPNGGSDILYILRYLVKKYHYVDVSAVTDLYDYSDNILTITVPLKKFVDKTVTFDYYFANDFIIMLTETKNFTVNSSLRTSVFALQNPGACPN